MCLILSLHVPSRFPINWPTYDRTKLLRNGLKRKKLPTQRFYFTHLDDVASGVVPLNQCTTDFSAITKYIHLKDLEKAIGERLLGRNSNGFKKRIFNMPITNCSLDTFNSYFGMYKKYGRTSNRRLESYNRIGDRELADGKTFHFEYPFLPSFNNSHWAINEYSLLESDEDDDAKEEIEWGNLGPMYAKMKLLIEQQQAVEQGWEHYRNVIYKLSITHNSITGLVTTSFCMMSLRMRGIQQFTESA